uniref:Putative LytR-membrane bound transcriptional regulator n=1 Tax=Paulinella longichromatophora TaxID=1708747 RepID=A0A2H4ZQE0_9EUKA|nr:putative LytR-membrane bound transcriptional regulator [Paulinella longichromatophora]
MADTCLVQNFHIRKASFLISLKAFLLYALMFKTSLPLKRYINHERATIISRKIPATFERPIHILVLAKDPVITNDSSISYNPNLFLLVVRESKALEILTFPRNLQITLPGQKHSLSFEKIYQVGNISLIIDLLNRIATLSYSPNRYLIVPSGYVTELLYNASNINSSLSTKLIQFISSFISKSQKEKNDNANKNTIFYSEKLKIAIRRRLYKPVILLKTPRSLNKFAEQMETNLTEEEALTVTASILNNSTESHVKEIQFRNIKSKDLSQELDKVNNSNMALKVISEY